MPNLTTFFWRTSSFSGSGQLNIGPEFIGHVNKFFRVQVRGSANYQGAGVTATSVFGNTIVFGVQQVPHTAAAEDLISSVDSETFFTRRETGSQDIAVAWAPSTSTAALLANVTLTDDWYGQLAVGLDTDIWVSLKTTDGSSMPNINTFGTVRVWWG